MKLTTTIKNLILRLLEQNRRTRFLTRLAACMAAVTVFITTYTLVLPAITAQLQDLELEPQLICAVEHDHTDACYREQQLSYGASQLPDMERLDYPHRVMLAAKSQLGADGDTADSIYTAWYTANAPEAQEPDPAAAFAAWCLAQAGVDAARMPTDGDPARMLALLNEAGLGYNDIDDTTRPTAGDLVFHQDGSGSVDAVGILTEVEGDSLTYVGVQPDGSVKQGSFALDEDTLHALTFAHLNAPEAVLPEETEEQRTDLPVLGHAEAVTGEETVLSDGLAAYAAPPMLLAEDGDTYSEAPAGVEVTPYVEDAKEDVVIRWSVDDGKSWHPITDVPQGGIPGNALLDVKVSYKGLNPSTLQANNYILYMKRPEGLIDLNAHGTILVANNERGTVRAIEDYVILEFDDFWVDDLVKGNAAGGSNTIKGDFSFQAAMDLDKIAQDGGLNLKFGDVVITVPSESDAKAKYGDLELTKQQGANLIKGDDGKYYMEYVLHVSTGRYGIDAVKVTDSFTSNAGAVERYVGVTDTAQQAAFASPAAGPVETSESTLARTGEVYTENGSLIWDVGSMNPYEERTLTYRVELTDNYVGVPREGSAGALQNTAVPTSKGLPHSSAVTNYNPTARTDLQKVAGEPYKGSDGLWYCDFTVRVTADRNNSYTLENVKLYDHIGRNENSGFRDFLNYVEGSAKVYRNAALTDEVTAEELHEIHPNEANPILKKDNVADGNKSLTAYVGDLAPNESRWMTYTMTLNLEGAQEVANKPIGFFNRVESYGDENRGNAFMNGYNTNNTLFNKTWNRKLGGTLDPQAKTISITSDGTNVFDATGSSVTRVTNPPASFAVPAGSYRYTIVVNETGDWDVSGSSLGDNLTTNNDNGGNVPSTHLQFSGYVRVDVYEQVDGSGGEDAVRQRLESQTPKRTVWVKVDGKNSFNFKGADLGLTGDDAYVMTYYASIPASASNFGQVTVGNSFSMSGSVIGPNGAPTINLQGVSANVSVTVKEPGVGTPDKKAWYYDPNDTAFEAYGMNHGAMYWVIALDGSKVVTDLKIQDSTNYGTFNNFIRKESVIGFFTANLGVDENGVPVRMEDKFESVEELLDAYDQQLPINKDDETLRLTKVPEDAYVTRWSGDGGGVNPWYVNANFKAVTDRNQNVYGEAWDYTITFTRDYVFNPGEKLYLIMRTEPGEMPGTGASTDYKNKVNFKGGPKDTWHSDSTRDTQTIWGPTGSMKKDFGGLFRVENSGTTAGSNRYTSAALDSYARKVRFEEFTGADGYPWSAMPTPAAATPNQSRKAELTNNRILLATNHGDLEAIADNSSTEMKQLYSPNGTAQDNVFLNYRYQDGAYLTWNLTVNTSGQMRGAYTIKDVLPEGLELAYVRTLSLSDNYTWAATHPGTVPSDYSVYSATREHTQLEDEEGYYARIVVSNRKDVSDKMDTVTEYYIKGNELAIYLPNVMANSPVTFQVVTRVTDPDVYYEDVDFGNTATVYDARGRMVEADSAQTTVKLGGLSKSNLAQMSGDEGDTLTNARMPYKIVLNETAGDMDSNSNSVSVPLIDHMSKNLSISMDTLRIYVDAEDESNLVYSSEEYGTLYKAVDDNGNQLYWQAVPTQTVDGVKKPSAATTIEPGQRDVQVVTTAANGRPIYPDAPYYAVATDPYATEFVTEYEEVNMAEMNQLGSGIYKIYNVRNGWVTSTRDSSNRLWGPGRRNDDFDHMERGSDFKFVKVGENTWNVICIDNESYNGKYLRLAGGVATWETNPQSLQVVMGTQAYPSFGQNGQYMNGHGNRPSFGGYNQLNDGGAPTRFFRQTAYPVGTTAHTLYWKSGTPMGTSVTPYPVILTSTIPPEGLDSDHIVPLPPSASEGEGKGNIPNVLQLRNAAGDLMVDASGNPILYTTDIRVAVEKYVSPSGVSDDSQVLKFYNLPDNHRIIITYDVTANLKGNGEDNSFSNEAYWEGYNPPADGNDHWENVKFEATASAAVVEHGAVKITKHNGANEAERLAGARFQLFRAEYVEHTCPQHGGSYHAIVWGRATDNGFVEDAPVSGLSDKFWPALFMGEGDNEHEVTVMRDYRTGTLLAWNNNGNWEQVTKNSPVGMHHKFDLDENDHLQLHADTRADPDAVLDWGETDAQGRVSYGLKSNYGTVIVKDATGTIRPLRAGETNPYGDSRIHFNKVYAIVEEKAPDGYDVDPTPHFFVVPNVDDVNISAGDYFYHSDWPENVHVCTRSLDDTPTFFLSVFDYKGSAQVGKVFGGNTPANAPGTYSFGIWSAADVTLGADGVPMAPSTAAMKDSASLTYTAADFDENGILPDHAKVATFNDLAFNQDYYIFELSDDGMPLVEGATGKVNGLDFTVHYGGTNKVTPTRDEEGKPIVPVLTTSNDQYELALTKRFHGLDGKPLGAGVPGVYTFGIQRVNADGSFGRVLGTQSISWERGDNAAEKTIYFRGLEPGVTYRLIELNVNGQPVEENGITGSWRVNYDNNVILLDSASVEVQTAVVVNSATVMLPMSGGTGTQWFTGIGLLLMAAAMLCGYKQLRKRKEGT